MRHAKSSWDDPTLDDHERPLNARGRDACEIMSSRLTAERLIPNTIWASSAVRTQETAMRMMRALPGPQTVVNVPGFYHASADQVLQILAGEPEPDGKLMLVGHNPGWSSLAEVMTGQILHMPTACILVMSRKDESAPYWSSSAWRAVGIFKPKDVQRG